LKFEIWSSYGCLKAGQNFSEHVMDVTHSGPECHVWARLVWGVAQIVVGSLCNSFNLVLTTHHLAIHVLFLGAIIK
jgi:hypothetical protein